MRWVTAHPLVGLDDSARGALGLLAGDLIGEIAREQPPSKIAAAPESQRLFFSTSSAPLWTALEPTISRVLFSKSGASNPAGLLGLAEAGNITLAVGRAVPWLTASGKPMTPFEVARILRSLPDAPWMPGLLARRSTSLGSLLGEPMLQHKKATLCGIRCSDEASSEAKFEPCHLAFEQLPDTLEQGEGVGRENLVVLWVGPGGLRFATGFECGRTLAPRTREWVNLLSLASGRATSEVIQSLVLDPVFAPLLPLFEFDHEKSFSRLHHFKKWCLEANDALWDRCETRKEGNVAREMVVLGKRSSLLFASFVRVAQENSPMGERVREIFGELWMRGKVRLEGLFTPDARLPSHKAMLTALGVPKAGKTSPRRKSAPNEAHAHRRLGLWRARRSGIEAMSLSDATLLSACAQLEGRLRQALSQRGLPLHLAPTVIIERASGSPEVAYVGGMKTLAVHPRLFERPWRHVVDAGMWALAHVLEDVYSGRRPRTGLAPTEGRLGGDRSSWELACDRLGLRAELRGSRERLSDVPEEAWLSSDGLEAEERRFLEKVDKLLALSSSANEHEAALAMERAQALLETRGTERHREGLGKRGQGARGPIEAGSGEPRTAQGSTSASSPFVSLTLSLGVAKITALHKALGSLLASHYQVRVVWGREYDVADAGEAVNLTLLGRREHVLLAEHVFDFLDHQLDSLWQRARRERGLASTGRLSFQLGLVAGFRGKLDAARNARRTADASRANDTAALLRLEIHDLDAFVSELYPDLTSLGRGSVTVKSDFYNAGKEEGERLTVHTPVASRNESGSTAPRVLTS